MKADMIQHSRSIVAQPWPLALKFGCHFWLRDVPLISVSNTMQLF